MKDRRAWLQIPLLLIILLLAASPSFAQAGFATGIAWRYTPAGAFPAGGTTITVCTSTATGTPCTPTVTIYKDSGLSIPVANPLAQCTTSPQLGCIDNLGNFSFYASVGVYTYTASGAGLAPYGPIPIVAYSGPGGPAGSVFPVTVSGTVNSGGIPCFNSTTNEESSATLAANSILLGGGAGGCISSNTTLPNATKAVTQSPGDTSTDVATDAFVAANASPFVSTGPSTNYTLSVSGGTISATNNLTGVVDYTSTDLSVIANDILTAKSATCGIIYLKTGVFQALTLNGSGPYYIFGFPTQAATNQACWWTVQGESTTFWAGEVGLPIQTGGTIIDVTTTAVATVGSTAIISPIYAKPYSTQYVQTSVVLKNTHLRFPLNTRGYEIGCDLYNAENVDIEDNLFDFNVQYSTLPTPSANTNIGCTSTFSGQGNIQYFARNFAVGFNIGYDWTSEHIVSISDTGIYNTYPWETGSANGTNSAPGVYHPDTIIHFVDQENTHDGILGPNMTQGSIVNIINYDMELINRSTPDIVETVPCNTRGMISYSAVSAGAPVGVVLPVSTLFKTGGQCIQQYNSGDAAPSLVSGNAGTHNSGSISTIASSAMNNALVNPGVMVAFVRWAVSSSQTVTGVADTATNTYADSGCSSALFNTSSSAVQIWIAPNTHTTASNIVTATFSGAVTFASINVMELIGVTSTVDACSIIQNQTNASPGANSLAITSMTTPTSGDLVVAGFGVQQLAGPTAGTIPGAANADPGNQYYNVLEYALQTVAGAYSSTAGDTDNPEQWGGVQVALRPTAAPTNSPAFQTVSTTGVIATGTLNITGSGGCGTLASKSGGAWAGTVTLGTFSSSCTLTITPGITAPHGWVCIANDITHPTEIFNQSATSTTACAELSTTASTSDVVNWSAIAF